MGDVYQVKIPPLNEPCDTEGATSMARHAVGLPIGDHDYYAVFGTTCYASVTGGAGMVIRVQAHFIHELGHGLGLDEGYSGACPIGAIIDHTCRDMRVYGDDLSWMGKLSSPEINAAQKEALLWFGAQQVSASGTYTIGALDVAPSMSDQRARAVKIPADGRLTPAVVYFEYRQGAPGVVVEVGSPNSGGWHHDTRMKGAPLLGGYLRPGTSLTFSQEVGPYGASVKHTVTVKVLSARLDEARVEVKFQ